MLRLSKITDYGVVVLSNLSNRDDRLASAVDIAGVTGIPEPTVAKVLKTAARANLVIGQRGAGGGYRLTRTADAISITEIIEAFEGPIALTACVDGGDGNCSVEAFCAMRQNWDTVNQAIRNALTKVTLRDMTSGKSKALAAFMDMEAAEPLQKPVSASTG